VVSYRTYGILALTLAMTAARPSQPLANRPRELEFKVTSFPYKHMTGEGQGEPIEFEMRALDADLKNSTNIRRKTTPYTVTVKGNEAYVLFRTVSGRDLLHVEVRATDHRSCQSTAPIILLIVRGDTCGGLFMDPRVDNGPLTN